MATWTKSPDYLKIYRKTWFGWMTIHTTDLISYNDPNNIDEEFNEIFRKYKSVYEDRYGFGKINIEVCYINWLLKP
jgi:hypothetical protein